MKGKELSCQDEAAPSCFGQSHVTPIACTLKAMANPHAGRAETGSYERGLDKTCPPNKT